MSATPTTPGTPTAGWYLDPNDAVLLRYHDGDRWTDDVREALPAELFGEHLPSAPAGGHDDHAEIPRGLTHSKILLGATVLGTFMGLVLLPVPAGVSLVFARRAETARRAGHLLTARRLHRLASRWRRVTYWTVPVITGVVSLWALVALLQFGSGS